MAKETDLGKVKELIELMITNNLVEVEIVDGNSKIMLKRPHTAQSIITHIPAPIQANDATPAAITPPQVADEAAPAQQEQELLEIAAPMVGTFYCSPSPDSEPFVSVGDRVDADKVVCIIEAMKVMNEIKAEVSGTINEIVCKTGQAVEFGEVMFRVRPD